MRHIRKGKEPPELTAWKQQENQDWKPTWDNLRGEPKQATHRHLLQEQGFICCYCGRRISRDDSHIEHLKPRSHPLYQDLALDYTNLLASCPGYPEVEADENISTGTPRSQESRSREHCGHKKDSWYDPDLMVSPFMENCADYFRFTDLGKIRAAQDPALQPAAQETIQRLGLDHSSLEAARKQAIAGVRQLLQKHPEAEDLRKLIQSCDRLDLDGKYLPYCTVILYVLHQFEKAQQSGKS
jgi:uncharacterized protein (TIGR02646 family)